MRRGGRRNNNGNEDADEEGSSRMYLRLDGVRGSVWDGPYQGCFAAESFQYGQGRGIGGGRRGGKREMSEPSVSEVSITLAFDARVNLLHGLCTAGAMFPTAAMAIVAGDTTTVCTMSDVVISGFSMSSGGGVPSVSCSLNFTHMTFTATTIVRKPIVVPAALLSQTPGKQPIVDMGKDGYYGIFRRLSPTQLLNAARVCKLWLSMASDPRLQLVDTTSMEYHPSANTVINGFRVSKSILSSMSNNYGGGSDEEGKEPETPVIYGREPVSEADLPYGAHLFQREEKL